MEGEAPASGGPDAEGSDMSRPYKRICSTCSREYISKSNTRIYCYQCSPPQRHSGGRRKDGMVSGVGLEPNAALVRRQRKSTFQGGKPDKDRIVSKESPVPDRLLDKAVREVEAAELQERSMVKTDEELHPSHRGRPNSVIPKNGTMMENSGGDKVLAYGRPELGWGKCKHIDPELKKETCIKERWSDKSPFCLEHLRYWRDKREENNARRVMEEEVSQFQDLSKENFFFKNAQDIMNFLSRVNFAVYKNWIPIGKARALSAIARVQIKALDSKIIAHRLHAIIMGLNKGQGGTSITTPEDMEEMEEDIERARMMGLEDLAKLVSDAKPEQQDKDIVFTPGGHPDLNPPDPRFPDHSDADDPVPPGTASPGLVVHGAGEKPPVPPSVSK